MIKKIPALIILTIVIIGAILLIFTLKLPHDTYLWRETQNLGHTPLFGIVAISILGILTAVRGEIIITAGSIISWRFREHRFSARRGNRPDMDPGRCGPSGLSKRFGRDNIVLGIISTCRYQGKIAEQQATT
jgi:hypothetical protein